MQPTRRDLPPPERCPYCAQCRDMGLAGCLGHYPWDEAEESPDEDD